MSQDKPARRQKELGRRLRIARTCKGWDLERLSVFSGLKRSKLEKYEAGSGMLTADELLAIGRVLEMPIWFLFEVKSKNDANSQPEH